MLVEIFVLNILEKLKIYFFKFSFDGVNQKGKFKIPHKSNINKKKRKTYLCTVSEVKFIFWPLFVK